MIWLNLIIFIRFNLLQNTIYFFKYIEYTDVTRGTDLLSYSEIFTIKTMQVLTTFIFKMCHITTASKMTVTFTSTSFLHTSLWILYWPENGHMALLKLLLYLIIIYSNIPNRCTWITTLRLMHCNVSMHLFYTSNNCFLNRWNTYITNVKINHLKHNTECVVYLYKLLYK